MEGVKLLRRENVMGGDTYELAYAHACPARRWSADSLYLEDDETGIKALTPYLDTLFPGFACHGPQKVLLTQWEELHAACRADASPEAFFRAVDSWLDAGNGEAAFLDFGDLTGGDEYGTARSVLPQHAGYAGRGI